MLLEPDRFLSPRGSKISHRAEKKVKETTKETGAGGTCHVAAA